MQPFDTKHYEKFLESRERAMSFLHRFYLEEQVAQYHLMMYMRQKKPLGFENAKLEPKKAQNMRNPTPYPEDMVFPT